MLSTNKELDERVDISENRILSTKVDVLIILLKDNTTGKNIVWATDNYEHLGFEYLSHKTITIQSVTGRNGNLIMPRVEKSKEDQQLRSKQKAEVFTPSWLCNKQNNLIDTAWFGYDDVFNIEEDKTWKTNGNNVDFSKANGKTWQDYVSDIRLEISCGEAPYLVSRYDTVTGDAIDVSERIGLLDRKIRVINENIEIDNILKWFEWVIKAYKSIYGYEWQGDNLLLARENLLYTFNDYYKDRFNENPSAAKEEEISNIISWNLWQMDGIKGVVPNSCKNESIVQTSFFDDEVLSEECTGCKKNNIMKHNGTYCKIKNWETNRNIKFISLMKAGNK